jgi:CheY-like chemotaxis protein
MMIPGEEGGAKSHASFLILAVDDDEDIRDLVTYLLQGEGYLVITAVDGPSALLQIENHHPDLVLLDVMLPGLTGLELLARIRNSKDERTRLMPVVMLSGIAGKSNPAVDQTSGVTEFLTKPFRSAHLLLLVSRLIAGISREE